MNFARKTFALVVAVLSLAALPGAAGVAPEGGMPLEADRAEAAAPKAPHELVVTDDMMIAWAGEDSPKYLEKFLVSNECAPLRVRMEEEINAVLHLGPEKVVEYACDDIQHKKEIRGGLKKLKKKAIQKKFKTMKKKKFNKMVVAKNDCKLATEMKLYEQIQMLEKVAGDPKLCREEMELALAAVEGDSTRRALLGGQEERRLALPLVIPAIRITIFLVRLWLKTREEPETDKEEDKEEDEEK